jgi:excisionase family DNA binding protein
MKTYDAQEAAAVLKVHENTVFKLANSGELRGAKLGKRWVFRECDLERFLQLRIDRQQRRAMQC